MKLNQKKETLIKKYMNLNIEVHEKVFEGCAVGDLIAFDERVFSEALRYLPNHILKKWIKKCKSEIKELEEQQASSCKLDNG